MLVLLRRGDDLEVPICPHCHNTDMRHLFKTDRSGEYVCLRRVAPTECAQALVATIEELEIYVRETIDDDGLVPCGQIFVHHSHQA